jgi:hypothetical protein
VENVGSTTLSTSLLQILSTRGACFGAVRLYLIHVRGLLNFEEVPRILFVGCCRSGRYLSSFDAVLFRVQISSICFFLSFLEVWIIQGNPTWYVVVRSTVFRIPMRTVSFSSLDR